MRLAAFRLQRYTAMSQLAKNLEWCYRLGLSQFPGSFPGPSAELRVLFQPRLVDGGFDRCCSSSLRSRSSSAAASAISCWACLQRPIVDLASLVLGSDGLRRSVRRIAPAKLMLANIAAVGSPN